MCPETLKGILTTIITEWNRDIHEECFPGYYACPVPFFGDILSEKPKLFTIGLNPSDREFLTCKKKPISPVRILDADSALNCDSLFDACQTYFDINPNRGWFGSSENSTKVEGFLNLMGASYYSNRGVKYQAIHLDLIPFPTLLKFSRFKKQNEGAVKQWIDAYGFPLLKLFVQEYRPVHIYCIGKEICSFFPHLSFHDGKISCSYKYFEGYYNGIPLTGSDVYFPNPIHHSVLRDWRQDLTPLFLKDK